MGLGQSPTSREQGVIELEEIVGKRGQRIPSDHWKGGKTCGQSVSQPLGGKKWENIQQRANLLEVYKGDCSKYIFSFSPSPFHLLPSILSSLSFSLSSPTF